MMYRPEGRHFLIAACCLLAAFAAAGGSFRSRARRADAFLRSGQPEKALETWEKLLVDYPDSAHVRYGIASVRYQQGVNRAEAGVGSEAAAAFDRARAAFERMSGLDDPEIRRHLEFGRANCIAWQAKLIAPVPEKVPPDHYEAVLKKLRGAVAAYESLLTAYPGHKNARQNLEHMRYILKRMLQHPPPPEETQQPPPENEDPPPPAGSRFTRVETGLPDAEAAVNEAGNIAELVRK
jgi:tetratricopeptide (TPR) repeat protein